MEEKELALHWQVLYNRKPELAEKVTAWRTQLTEDETIPRKYKELMMLAMACVIRYPEGIRTHAGYARANGASVEELYAAVAQTMTIGGIPAYRVGINTLQELW